MRLRAWLYNAFFVTALPALLIFWAGAMEGFVTLAPAPVSLGPPLLLAGGILLAWSMAVFVLETGHIPSNARSPSRRAIGGPYTVVSDPIYVGASLVAFGAAAWSESASGFWVVAPTLALSAASLVFGHEALRRPLLAEEEERSLLSLPEGSDGPPSLRQRFGSTLQIASWVLALELISVASGRAPVVSPILVVALAAPFLPWNDSTWTLRRALIGFHAAMLLAVLILAGPAPLFDSTASSSTLAAGAAIGGLAGARASSTDRRLRLLHVAMLAVAAALIAAIGSPPQLKAALLTTCISAICMPAHRLALLAAETIANSWSAVRIGPLRIINYAAYAFTATALGGLIFFSVVGTNAATAGLVITAFVVVSAGLWGQLVEFSGKLARPFGYYGALIGAFFGVSATAMLLDLSPWLLGAGLALAAPVVQAIGRLRCLVQGCCHGACVKEHTRGITYRRQQSRVLRIAKLGFQPVHPTPLYSIYANLAVLLVLWRLDMAGAMQTHVIAAYLIISGASRFIEEAYRGEPQTPKWQGLKLYQWLALAQGLAGIGLSLIPSSAMPVLTVPSSAHIIIASTMGLIAGGAMGADFPDSRRRFSQLTPRDL